MSQASPDTTRAYAPRPTHYYRDLARDTVLGAIAGLVVSSALAVILLAVVLR